MHVTNMRPMTLTEAKATLAAIGYRPTMTFEQLLAAVSVDLAPRVVLALRTTAAAEHDQANRLGQ